MKIDKTYLKVIEKEFDKTLSQGVDYSINWETGEVNFVDTHGDIIGIIMNIIKKVTNYRSRELECLKVLDNLNEKLYDADENTYYSFIYETVGHTDYIKINNHVLWDSGDDCREFFEDKNEYEDLEGFVIKQYKKYIETLSKVF